MSSSIGTGYSRNTRKLFIQSWWRLQDSFSSCFKSCRRGTGYSSNTRKLFIQSWWRLQDSSSSFIKSISRKKGYCLKSTKPLIYHIERVSVMFVKPNCKTLTFQNCNSVTLESSHRLAETGSKPAGKGINSGTVICLTATHEFTPRRKLQFDTYLRFFKVPTQNETSWSADL